jgi:hypothetical protein
VSYAEYYSFFDFSAFPSALFVREKKSCDEIRMPKFELHLGRLQFTPTFPSM